MNESLRLVGTKAFTIAVAAATVIWMVGAAAFVAPLAADAASMGSLIKGPTLSTLYYYGSDGQRYAFPNEKTFFTWYTDFSSVETISDSELAAIPLAGNVVYRAGSRFLKIQSDPKTYAVGPQGQIRWIETEAVAQGLAGADWAQFVDDVADVFFTDYTVGASLTSATNGYNGMLLEGSVLLVENGECREVSDAGFAANRFQTRFIVPGPDVDCMALPAGSMVTGAEGDLSDPAQLGAVVTGGLNVSLASDTPASATIPAGAASVPFVKVRLEAQSGSAAVSQMRFRLGGVGGTANIDEAYLYDGSTRLTDGRNVNSSTREVTFNALPFDLSTGEMTYAGVRADISAAPTGGDTANFGLTGPASLTSTATTSGNFPVVGNTMTFSATSAGTLVIDERGTISDPTLGQKEAVIAKFSAEAQNEDANLYELTLNVDDAKDHSNYKLWNGNELLAVGVVVGDLVIFLLTNPLFVEEGQTENLELTADIGGDAADEIKVAVEEEADVLATGGDFGFNLAVDITGYDDEGAACLGAAQGCSHSDIQGGDLTFAFNGPSSDDIQVDGDDQNIFEFTVTSENWTELQTMQIDVDCVTGAQCDADLNDAGGLYDSADPNFDDLTIRRDDGSAFMGPEEMASAPVAADDGTHAIDYSDNQTLQPGTSLDLMFTWDVANNTDAGFVGNQFRATLDMSEVTAEDINGDALGTGDIVPGSDLTGNLFTITEASLDVVASSPPSDATYVKGAQNVDVVGYNYEAGDASSVTVTDVTYHAMGDDDGSFVTGGGDDDDDLEIEDRVNSCSLYDAESGAHIDGPEGIEGDHNIMFDDFSWTIPAGETKKQKARCNFANLAQAATGSTDAYAFFIEDSTTIEAQDDDGDDLTATLAATDNADGGVATISIRDAGTLAFSLDGSTPKSSLILGDSTGVLVSVFKGQAEFENFLVKELTLDNCVLTTADADGDCADGGEVAGSDDIASSVKVEYDNEAGDTVSKTGFLSAGSINLDGMAWWVPSSGTRAIDVMVDSNSVSATGANSGAQIQLNLDVEDSGTATFEAVGDASGATLTEGDVDTYVVANDHFIRKTKPTITLNAASPSGASTPSFQETLRFNVAADSRGFVVLNAFTMRVNSTDNNGDGGIGLNWNDCDNFANAADWDFYDASDPSEKLDDNSDWFWLEDGSHANAAVDDACTTDTPVAFAILDLAADTTTPAEEIGAGETNTYVVKVDSSAASAADDDTFRLDLIDEDEATTQDAIEDCSDGAGTDCTSYDANDTDDGQGAGELNALSWDDDVEASEISGDLIKNLPVTGGTLVF